MKYLILAIAAAMLFSCNSTAKKIQKAREVLNANPPAGAQYCADNFPAKDSFLPGDTVVLHDTLEVDGPMITIRVNDTVTVKGQCPPTKVIRDTRTIHDTIIRVDRAAVEACQGKLSTATNTILEQAKEIDDLKAFKASMRGKIHISWYWVVIACIALLGWAYYRIKAGALKSLINKLK